jgi:putative aldouronate transport system substrate-binding protein
MKKIVLLVMIVVCLVSAHVFAGGQAASGGAKEKPILKWVGVYTNVIKPGEDPIEQEIEEATGYKVEYTMLPQAQGNEKLFLELASGTEYDIIKIPPAWFNKLVGEKAIIPMAPYLEKYGNNIKQAIEPETWKLSTYDGVIYGIPQKSERVVIGTGTIIRKDLLDALGLNLPLTQIDYYNVLKQIKQKYPDMVPLSITSTDTFINTIASAFGIYTEWSDINGVLVHRIHLPQTKNYFEYMTRLYSEGLLDPDYPINKRVNMEEKFTSGRAAALLCGYTQSETVRPAIDKSVPGNKLAIVQPLAGTDGSRGVQTSINLNYISCIPRTSKHPDDAMQFLNAKLDLATFKYLALGKEGETYTLTNGNYNPIMPIFNQKRNTAYWYLNGVWEKEYSDMWLARVRRNADVGRFFDELNLETSKLSKANPVAFKPPLDTFTKYEQVVNVMINDNAIKFISGVQKFDQYDAFLKAVDGAGLAEMTTEINLWYKASKQ